MKYLKTYTLFEGVSNETRLFESKSSLKFTKQPSKKGSKTETYNVIKDGEVIGQIKWSSRMRGYAFLPEKEHDDEIKKFIKDLMNKRKKSKLLESNWYEMKDHIKVLSDMSLPLWDKDFNVQVADEIISREHQCIVVNIVKKGSKKFTYTEIKEEILEMVGYMDIEGWEILNMVQWVSIGWGDCKLDGDKLVNMSGEEIDYQFDQLWVKFVEKKEVRTNESTEESIHREMMIKKYGVEEIEECDSVISDVKDMLLELNDLEIFTSIDYTPMTYMCIEQTSPKLFLNIKCDSKLWNSNEILINDLIDTIKNYLKSYRFCYGSNKKEEERVGLTDKYEVEYQILIQK
jgi:hypothetical protein